MTLTIPPNTGSDNVPILSQSSTVLFFLFFFFLPFAANLRERTNHELLLRKIIMEGVIAIEGELNPTVMKTKLLSFLTPSARKADLVPLARISKRFNISEFSEPVHSTVPNP